MIKELLVDNIVLICTIIFLVLMGLWGRHRGFIRMITSTAALVISLFIARGFMSKLAAKMMEHDAWKTWVETRVLPKLNGIGAETVFNALSFLVIFTVSMILIRMLAATLDRLSESVFSIVNEVFGLVVGVIEGILFLWIFMIFVDVMPQLPFCEFVAKQIAAEPILTLLHDNNLIVSFLQSVLVTAPNAAMPVETLPGETLPGETLPEETLKILESTANL